MVETRGWLKFIILAGLLPAKRVLVLVEECDPLCRILGKSIAAAKAGRRQLPGDGLETTLAITDDKFSIRTRGALPSVVLTTNSQLKGPKS